MTKISKLKLSAIIICGAISDIAAKELKAEESYAIDTLHASSTDYWDLVHAGINSAFYSLAPSNINEYIAKEQIFYREPIEAYGLGFIDYEVRTVKFNWSPPGSSDHWKV